VVLDTGHDVIDKDYVDYKIPGPLCATIPLTLAKLWPLTDSHYHHHRVLRQEAAYLFLLESPVELTDEQSVLVSSHV